jgi:two-component system, LytTR family, response regulator
MLRAIIIDDEEHCIKTLEWTLQKYWAKGIEVIATSTVSIQGLKLVNELKPDIVFLDIEMPHLNGIDLATMIQHNESNIVFTTAYDQYAIKAIKLNALDYLLKPIDDDELCKVIEKIENCVELKNPQKFQELQEAHQSKVLDKIALNNMNGFSIVSFKDILYIQGENTYSDFKLINGSKILISKTLSSVEEMIDMNIFFRAHKSYIINLSHVSKYIKGDGGEVVMADGTSIAISRRRKDDFLKMFT